MTGEPVLVTAEWALYASNGGPDGPQLLASSLGRFGSSDFEALLATSVQVIPPGQLEVTVASLVGPGTGDYLGLVIHNTPSLGGHGLANDHMLTACFCLPWEQLAAGPVPYLAMFDSLSAISLPVNDRGLIEAWVTPMTLAPMPWSSLPAEPHDGRLATTVAALLLTGRSVCILGAGDVAAVERLRFLDEVLALLPYGVRGQLPVATWAATGQQGFRLFFGMAAESADCHVVTWGRESPSQLPGGDQIVSSYLRWLRGPGRRSQLAELTAPVDLGPAGVVRLLDELGIGVDGSLDGNPVGTSAASDARASGPISRRRATAGAARQPVAFLSYARSDDEYERGRLTRFCAELTKTLRFYTGQEFIIFQDTGIELGVDWENRINEALDAATFFIPIVTPSYLSSDFCRYEVERFVVRERGLGRSDLIIPVYYLSCPQIENLDLRQEDEIAVILAARQGKNWRDLRLMDSTSPQVQAGLEEIASRMRDALATPGVSTPSGSPAVGRARFPAQRSDVLVPGIALARGTEARLVHRDQAYDTFYVDPYGQGNFESIRAAIEAAKPGDHILVRPGLYRMDRRSLIIDKPLVIEGVGSREDIVVRAVGADVFRFAADIGRITNLTLRQVGGGSRWNCVNIIGGRLELEACDISCESSSGVSIVNGADPRVRANVIHDCRQSGVLIYDGGRGRLEDNEVYGNAQAGVEIKTGGNPELARNRIRDCGDGIVVHSAGQGIIEDNEIHGMAQYGVAVKGGTPVLRRNSIYRCARVGVYIYDRGAGTLTDNDIYSHGSSGVAIKSGARPVLSGNRIRECEESGVLICDGGSVTLDGNYIFRNALNGVEVRDGSAAVLRRNEIQFNRKRALLAMPGATVVDEGNVFDGVRSTADGNRRNRLVTLFRRPRTLYRSN